MSVPEQPRKASKSPKAQPRYSPWWKWLKFWKRLATPIPDKTVAEPVVDAAKESSAQPLRAFRSKDDLNWQLPQIPIELVAAFRQLVETRLNIDRLSPLQCLEAIYAYLNQYNRFVATFSVCQKGCSACCHIDVAVTRLEADYITKKTGRTFSRGTNITTEHRRPCPFLQLDTGACSIYDARPFNCRTFHTLDDPKYCSTEESHQVYGVSTLGYSSRIYYQLAEWLQAQQHNHSRDIRDWFPE